MAEGYGVLRADGKSERALFLIDQHGLIQYVDVHDIDHQPDNEVLLAEIRRMDPRAAASEPVRPEEPPLPHGGIVMYCTPWCEDCKNARAWLKARGLVWTEVDLAHSKKATVQVRTWTGGNLITPTFDIDGTVIIDFDEDALCRALGMGR